LWAIKENKMCHYISGIIKSDFDLEKLNSISREHWISYDSCNNEFVIAQLRESEKYLVKHTKICDCGTELGSLNKLNQFKEQRVEKREIDKLISKGWSELKINRWIVDRKKSIQKEKTKYDNYLNNSHSDIDRWMNFFNDLFNKTDIRYFGILLHFYKGGIASERIKIKNREKICFDSLCDKLLLEIDEDIIYDIIK
jgi:hypothetical protein